jgi:hypothetical protein
MSSWTLQVIKANLEEATALAETDPAHAQISANAALLELARYLAERLPDGNERADVQCIINLYTTF